MTSPGHEELLPVAFQPLDTCNGDITRHVAKTQKNIWNLEHADCVNFRMLLDLWLLYIPSSVYIQILFQTYLNAKMGYELQGSIWFSDKPATATTPVKRREKHIMVPVKSKTVTQELSDALRYLEDSVSKIPRKSSGGAHPPSPRHVSFFSVKTFHMHP